MKEQIQFIIILFIIIFLEEFEPNNPVENTEGLDQYLVGHWQILPLGRQDTICRESDTCSPTLDFAHSIKKETKPHGGQSMPQSNFTTIKYAFIKQTQRNRTKLV